MVMDTLLLGITVVSLIVALVMSVSAWRVGRDEKRRAAARVAALSAASTEPAARQAPWAPSAASARPKAAYSRIEPDPVPEDTGTAPFDHSPFLGTASTATASGGRQRSLAWTAAGLFVILSAGVVWTMSAPRGTTPRAGGPNNPIELISLNHNRQASKLSISGLVRNPLSGQPMERITAVVFLFDQKGAFVASARAPLDFIKLGVGDESPFVVTVDAPASVARYRVSFRSDEATVPHIDRRGAPPVAGPGEQPVSVSLK